MFGPSLKPGEYTVRIVKNDQVEEGRFTVKYDPNSRHTIEERETRHEYVMRAYHQLEDLAFTVEKMNRLRRDCEKTGEAVEDKELSTMIMALRDSLSGIHRQLVSTENRGIFGSQEKVREKLANLYSAIIRYQGKPTQSQMDRLDLLAKEVEKHEQRFDQLIQNKLEPINTQLKSFGHPAIKLLTREQFDEEDGD